MIFRQLFDPDSSTYTYLLGDAASQEALLIDPVKEQVPTYLALLEKLSLKLKYSLDTHVHADHVTGSGLLREQTGCQTALGDKAKAKCVDLRLKDGDTLRVGRQEIKALATPGHTPCHMAYLIGDRLFSGDALFVNGCGRTDFQGGSPEQLWDSVVEKLFKLPDETLVYPGHDYNHHHVSSIQQEKETNPRFKKQTRESFVDLMNHLDLPNPKQMMQAVPANEQCGV